jgi:predicted DNA-binding transcriptional regulator AlpA
MPFNLRRSIRHCDCEVIAMPDLLNTEQAAVRCCLSKRTLEKYRGTGAGPLYIQLGKAVRYRDEDLEAWIAAHRRRSTSDDLPTRC